MGSTRYVKAVQATFWDLQRALGVTGAIHAVEVDHIRGLITVVCESPSGVLEGQTCKVEAANVVG